LTGILATDNVPVGTIGPREGDSEPEKIDINRTQIKYLKVGEGEGPPVVLLHSFGGDINIWAFSQEALAEGHTLYA
jgi:pyruvate dehydrogenase E2 component (dihydrolipoamide acetyltransferase)